jgi:hypothetical protein
MITLTSLFDYLDTILRLGWHSLAGSVKNSSACLDSTKQLFYEEWRD